jgi:hypothetical protein
LFSWRDIVMHERAMSDLDQVRAEVEHMRAQVGRQRKEILQLQRAGILTASAEALLERMKATLDAWSKRATG